MFKSRHFIDIIIILILMEIITIFVELKIQKTDYGQVVLSGIFIIIMIYILIKNK